MNIVYAAQIPKRSDPQGRVVPVHDLSAALEYGDVEQLLPPGPVLLSPETAIRTLDHKLREFDDTDHVLCLGDPVAIAAACMVAGAINNGRVKVLVYDRETRAYNSVQIDISDLANVDKPDHHDALEN